MYHLGYGVDKNGKKSFLYMYKAAKQNKAEAQYLVGSHYNLGDHITRNDKKAFEWFKKAADQGNEDAEIALIEYFDYP